MQMLRLENHTLRMHRRRIREDFAGVRLVQVDTVTGDLPSKYSIASFSDEHFLDSFIEQNKGYVRWAQRLEVDDASTYEQFLGVGLRVAQSLEGKVKEYHQREFKSTWAKLCAGLTGKIDEYIDRTRKRYHALDTEETHDSLAQLRDEDIRKYELVKGKLKNKHVSHEYVPRPSIEVIEPLYSVIPSNLQNTLLEIALEDDEYLAAIQAVVDSTGIQDASAVITYVSHELEYGPGNSIWDKLSSMEKQTPDFFVWLSRMNTTEHSVWAYNVADACADNPLAQQLFDEVIAVLDADTDDDEAQDIIDAYARH